MTLNTVGSKAPRICSTSTPKSQISLHFILRLTISKILAIFNFPIDYNVKFLLLFVLNLIFQNAKIGFVWTVTGNSRKRLLEKNLVSVEEVD